MSSRGRSPTTRERAEVTRLQYDQKMSPLAALQTVYAKLASGWLPPVPR